MNDRLKVAMHLLAGSEWWVDAGLEVRQALDAATMLVELEAQLQHDEGGASGIPLKRKCTCGHYPTLHSDDEDHPCDAIDCDCEKFVAVAAGAK